MHGTTFGVVKYNITFVVPDGRRIEPTELQQRVQGLLDRINGAMSTYIDESEVSRFNDSPATEWFPVSMETAAVVAAAQQVSEQSEGAFDITVGPLVDAWHFGPNKGSLEIPSDETIEVLRDRVGYQKLDVRSDPPALRKSDPELRIDLSAIAKGYAVDAVSRLLSEQGYVDHLVEIGGEDRASGNRPGGGPWRVGIERPDRTASVWDASESFQRIVKLQDEAIATSGDYRNFFIGPDGQRYSHTIDPRTGRPATQEVASVSVVTKNCMEADAWATAIGVMGPNRAIEAAEKHGLEVLVVYRTKDGKYKEAATGRFADQTAR